MGKAMAVSDNAAGPSEPRIIVIRRDDTALHLYRSVADMLNDADVAPGGPVEFYSVAGARLEPEFASWRIVALRPTDDQIDQAALVQRFATVLRNVSRKIEPPVALIGDSGRTPRATPADLPEIDGGDLAEDLTALWRDFGHSSLEPPSTLGSPLHMLFCH
jgi:hypothetical protein